jgi:putative adhesin
MTEALTPGRRALLTLGGPIALATIGYGAFSIVSAIGLTHYSQTYLVVPHSQVLNVKADEGGVRLQPSPDSNVHIVSKGVYALKIPKVEATSTASSLTIKGSCPLSGAAICSQTITIQVPAAFTITASSNGGDVHATGLTGRLTLTSSAGDVDGNDLGSTDVTASSSGGDVDLRFATVPQRVEASSSAGDVSLRLPDSVYAVEAQTSAGDTVVKVPTDPRSTRTVHAHSSAGDVAVRLN